VKFRFGVNRLFILNLLQDVLSECCCEIALREKGLKLLITNIYE
jgi:hypothetical protein